MTIFRFFKMAAIRHLGFVGAFWGHPLRVLGGLYDLSRSDWNPFCSFYNIKFQYFARFDWEMSIHAPKIGVCGRYDP